MAQSGDRSNEAWERLRALEARALEAAGSFRAPAPTRGRLQGIGFRLGPARFVAGMGEVREVLHLPRIARLPGTREWVRGVANLRGALLPVIDLPGFLLGQPGPAGRESRVLVVEAAGMTVGLHVDEVTGLRHLEPEARLAVSDAAPEGARSFLTGSFEDEQGVWHEIDLAAVIATPRFARVAA